MIMGCEILILRWNLKKRFIFCIIRADKKTTIPKTGEKLRKTYIDG